MPITASRSPVWRCREKIHLTLLLSLERISIALNHLTVAGLATSNAKALSENNRGGRDKPGHDRDRGPPVPIKDSRALATSPAR